MEFEDEVLRRLGSIDKTVTGICEYNKKQDERCRQTHSLSDDRLAHIETGAVLTKECGAHRAEIFKTIRNSDLWTKGLLVSILLAAIGIIIKG